MSFRGSRTGGLPGSLALAVVAALVAPSCGEGTSGGGAPRSAVLITLDTTRPDALGFSGGPRGLTPHLDSLAAESVIYGAARTVAPITLPAHVSMMTGLVPLRHAIRDNNLMTLSEEAVTLAELAQARGHDTAAFVSAVVLDASYALDQGFERYVGPPRGGHGPAGGEGAELDAPTVARAAVTWLEQRDPERPFFLWVHFFDPHLPYTPSREHMQRARGNPYHAEVARMDDGVGMLLAALRADPAWDETAVVVVADHGEGLGQHGEDTHSFFAYDSTIRVPMSVRWPDGDRAGERTDEPVSVVDVFPTLVEALALGSPGDVDGRSLYRRRIPPDRACYFETYYGRIHHGWAPVVGVADGSWKYIHGPAPELYAWREDPGETRDRMGEHPGEVAQLTAHLEDFAGRERLSAATDTIDSALLEQLRSLGYAGGGDLALPEPLESTDLLPAHGRAEELRNMLHAWAASDAGKLDDAVRLWDEVLASNPANHDVLWVKGRRLVEAGRFAEALVPLTRFRQVGPPWPEVEFNIGLCQRSLGDDDAALEAYRRAIAIDPRMRIAIEGALEILEERGDQVEAAKYRTLWAQASLGG